MATVIEDRLVILNGGKQVMRKVNLYYLNKRQEHELSKPFLKSKPLIWMYIFFIWTGICHDSH